MSAKTVCIGSYCFRLPFVDEAGEGVARDLTIRLSALAAMAFVEAITILAGYSFYNAAPDLWSHPIGLLGYFLSQ